MVCVSPATAQDRATVDASEPEDIAVTVYRDPNRAPWQQLNPRWPRGFAMISETRTVTLPPGESRIRFEGVAEGMVAVSAIVTGLPGGTIEKNRNADLLSPAALVDGTLGNRVQITRTNPATGEAETSDAIVRTRADGGLVLQTEQGFEAVRCSGLPERLTFDGVPEGLSAEPVFSIDTRSDTGGTYQVTLSYLSWGFDWQANYVASVDEGGDSEDVRFDLNAWLTILNDNGQSFENAELMAVAGRLNTVSDFRRLADPPDAEPLRLTCWPRGSTAAGSPVPVYESYEEELREQIVVTARRVEQDFAPGAPPPPPPPPPPPAPVAAQEDLGDLKLYRIPMRTDVNAQGLKQVAFLLEEDIEGELFYEASCTPWESRGAPVPAQMRLDTVNDEDHGLGAPLPAGQVAIFEGSSVGDLLVAETNLRDYAVGQDVEMPLGPSSQVFTTCRWLRDQTTNDWQQDWSGLNGEVHNANPHPVTIEIAVAMVAEWDVRGLDTVVRDGRRFARVEVPANSTHAFAWEVKLPHIED
ncbi:hypothetical protein BMF35_a1576 [Aurantiacibacter gangjinensis]|nr:hypothetical protein BMF35_a1576 [Aurantiacibacter gangjinensis]